MNTVVGANFAFRFKDFESRAIEAAKEVFADGHGPDKAALRFLEQIHEDAVAEDLEQISVDDMVSLAARFWAWAQERARGRTIIRVEAGQRADGAPLHRDVLEIVTDDKPFLVDSIVGELNEQGLEVLAMFHPIVTVERDETGRRSDRGAPVCESLIQVHLEPLDLESRARLLAGLRATIEDVAAAVADFADMRARMDQAIDELKLAPTAASREELDETVAFLRWLRDDRFAFLGCRVYEFPTAPDGSLLNEEPDILEETGRGVLRDPARHVLRRGSEPAIITPAIREFLREPAPLIVAKANMRSRVHRRVYMDYIGVKRYRADGEVIGETRFVGLFTSEAYFTPVRDVPLARRKVRRVLERADKQPGSHNFKQLKNIIETYPRDELLQSDENELLEICLGVLHLYDRPRTKLFIRRDRFDRFISAFVFIPRERYNSTLRAQITDVLINAYNGRLSAFYPSFSDGPLARVHFIIGLNPFDHPEPDVAEIEQRITELARTWQDDFVRAARRSGAPEAVRRSVHEYEHAFSAGYREVFGAVEAIVDADEIEQVDPEIAAGVRAYRRPDDAPDTLRFKLYKLGDAAELSDIMPILEQMGLKVVSETPYPVRRGDRAALSGAEQGANGVPAAAWIHDFEMRLEDGPMDIAAVAPAFEDAFIATWTGRNETDGFNRLILRMGAPWREICFIRAAARYRQQTGLDPSQQVQEEALAEHPAIARLILSLKRVRFDPAYGGDLEARGKAQEALEQEFVDALEQVESLDHDRVLRRLWRLVCAVQRTNFYQRDLDGAPHPHIAIKIASRDIDELPAPKPYREIFVWAPHVEGVHLRFGAVARGGLRWSDRRDDFRTEVLGLVKAQQVKNAVIVPVGAKGGFFPKHLPRGGSREEVQAEAIRAYRTFISALLDITDNIVDDQVSRPKDVIAWDGEDPYLVVAADKGTAAFSDIANEVAVSYGFWLGDAFASGGSAGYDHKKMGITARGAWVAVQRHFREMGKDIQHEPFSVIGVGDMSGDVFGNGMLLSRKIRLIAAFDHRDIFIDPDPEDLEASFNERKRLFDMGRSSWRDYDTRLISDGGGVFSRAAKSVPLSPEMRALTGLEKTAASPAELINALLKADIELMWFGGIGTYVKADHEQSWQVGDKANDAVRIDAQELRAKVIGEGANLGVTQAGRVELSRLGVRLNADFIDNAAGVDSSDNEVNIKILVNQRVRANALAMDERNALLAEMTDDVAEHVLDHVYDQTLALSLAEADAVYDLDAYERLIERLEARGSLDRAVEGLPSAEQFRELKAQNSSLTRPEIAVLISYAKISLFDRILDSSVPDDEYFETMLASYFPKGVQGYREEMRNHRLKREIISTVLANDLVNLGGATFTHRARESTGGDTDAVARGFEAARAIFGFRDLLDRIHGLDNKAAWAVQRDLYGEIVRLLRRQTYWLVRRGRGFEQTTPRPLIETIEAYKPGVDDMRAYVLDVISPFERKRVERRAAGLIEGGAPEDLAREVASLRPLTSSSDVIDLADKRAWPLKPVAQLYHAFGAGLSFDRLRAVGGELSSAVHWDRLATRRLIEDLYAEQQRLVDCAMAMVERQAGEQSIAEHLETVDADWAKATLEAFMQANRYEGDRAAEALAELTQEPPWTLSKLAIASTALREFASLAQG